LINDVSAMSSKRRSAFAGGNLGGNGDCGGVGGSGVSPALDVATSQSALSSSSSSSFISLTVPAVAPVLVVSLFDWDRMSRDDFLGELLFCVFVL
jgi:hypothetical protein